jgi:RNA polymerase sigma-70 factor (ECF subfamily)
MSKDTLPGRALAGVMPGRKPVPYISVPETEPFTALYEQHVEQIYRYHLARTGSVEDAQDLTAETFRAALESFARYRPERGAAIAWLMGIASHKQADHFRRARHGLPLAEAENRADGRPSPEESAAQRLQMAQVAGVLRRLPSDRAEALALHFFAGLELGEVGQAMNKSNAAVKKLIHRGLGDLREWLIPAQEVTK